MRVLATHSICQFPLHFPSRASPCATRFRTSSTFDAQAALPLEENNQVCIGWVAGRATLPVGTQWRTEGSLEPPKRLTRAVSRLLIPQASSRNE